MPKNRKDWRILSDKQMKKKRKIGQIMDKFRLFNGMEMPNTSHFESLHKWFFLKIKEMLSLFLNLQRFAFISYKKSQNLTVSYKNILNM